VGRRADSDYDLLVVVPVTCRRNCARSQLDIRTARGASAQRPTLLVCTENGSARALSVVSSIHETVMSEGKLL